MEDFQVLPFPLFPKPPCIPTVHTEVKHLKQLVRDVVDPGRGLGHVDGKKVKKEEAMERKDGQEGDRDEKTGGDRVGCEDCK